MGGPWSGVRKYKEGKEGASAPGKYPSGNADPMNGPRWGGGGVKEKQTT